MSEFSGINQFGHLTTNYKTLVEKYDQNGDGILSAAEFRVAQKEEDGLDKVELSYIDSNCDNVVTEDEMAVYEQKYQMQEVVNSMGAQISIDFSGAKAQYLPQVTSELTNYIIEFTRDYIQQENADVSGMVEAFTKALPTKYAEIKKNILVSEPGSFKSKVLDNIINSLQSSETISDAVLVKIGKTLETEADKYIKLNPNCSEEELMTHLESFLYESDAEKMKSAADAFKTSAASFGVYIDSNELIQLKEYAKEFLTEALNNGVTVKLGGRNIATTNAIATALKSYTDGATLKADMEEAIAELGVWSKKDTIAYLEHAKTTTKNFASLKGSECQVNAGLIDYSIIDSRYFNGGDIYQRGKGWSGSRDKAYDEGYSILTSDNMKSQIKSQIETTLKEQGIPFNMIAELFENVYNQTAQEVLNSDGMITGRGARFLSRKGKAYIDVKTMIDTFITTFNTNIAKAVDEVNASDKDMDVLDLDYTKAGKDENGNAITDELTGTDLSTLYTTEKTITKKTLYRDKHYSKLAENMVERMKNQMKAKAMTMCDANGIGFDENVFDTMFNNAKQTAVNASITTSEQYNMFTLLYETKFNAKTLLDTFAENFKTNYSLWVQSEANKPKK